MTDSTPTYDIPQECIAGVVVNEGPDFRLEVQKIPVPEIGKLLSSEEIAFAVLTIPKRPRGCTD